MSKNHVLKSWPAFFEEVLSWDKLFEIRKNDRNFQLKDTLELWEYEPKINEYSGRRIYVTVVYITDLFVPKGFVAMGIKINNRVLTTTDKPKLSE